MTISKTISTVGVGAAIVAGSMFAVTATSAHFGAGSEENKAERASALAEKLGVDVSQVETAFDELQAERQAEMEAQRAERIAGLVTDGTLTQAQADALTAKQAEIKSAREALKDQDLTQEEIREQMNSLKEEFKTWAEAQGIDLEAIRPDKGEGFGRGNGHGHGAPADVEADDSSSES